ncbi:hypothetical protein [Neobacillus cucumis]|nr:hypothetical protein [Neobacillus cucumis]
MKNIIKEPMKEALSPSTIIAKKIWYERYSELLEDPVSLYQIST